MGGSAEFLFLAQFFTRAKWLFPIKLVCWMLETAIWENIAYGNL